MCKRLDPALELAALLRGKTVISYSWHLPGALPGGSGVRVCLERVVVT